MTKQNKKTEYTKLKMIQNVSITGDIAVIVFDSLSIGLNPLICCGTSSGEVR